MRHLIESIVKALVEDESAVEIEEIEGSQSTIIEVRVSKIDIGKVIGRRGRMADAIRTIMSGVGAVKQRRYILQVLDEGPME